MKVKLLVVLSIAALSLTSISSCKKNGVSPKAIVQVDYTKNGQTISVATGQSLQLTLGNPGDGGYDFDTPQFNPLVLSLVSHAHTNPGTNAPVGNAGTDTWEFKALAAGESVLKVTATRSFDKNNPATIFIGKVAAN
ncbi:MAG: protease inhibitor I42 family protein [Mucilaginibacter sp.]